MNVFASDGNKEVGEEVNDEAGGYKCSQKSKKNNERDTFVRFGPESMDDGWRHGFNCSKRG